MSIIAMSQSKVKQFFSAKTVLVTGATGLVGKALLWKLLHSTDIQTIYVIVRQKRGTTPRDRVKDLLSRPPFSTCGDLKDGQLDKVTVVEGDFDRDDVGLSSENRTLLQKQVAVVFHAAACTKFNVPFSDQFRRNVIATKFLLDLFKDSSSLTRFIHVSPVAVGCHIESRLEEQLLHLNYDLEDLFRLYKMFQDEPQAFDDVAKHLYLENHNSYTYSKLLAEHLFDSTRSSVPATIVRLPIMTPSVSEPVAGWFDVVSTGSVVMGTVAAGLVRVIEMKRSSTLPVTPLDVAVNSLLNVAATATGNMDVLTLPPSPHSLMDQLTATRCFADFPTKFVVRTPNVEVVIPTWKSAAKRLVFQRLFALLLDILLVMRLRKPIMSKAVTKIEEGFQYMKSLSTKKWTLKTEKFSALLQQQQVNDDDRREFKTDTNHDLESYAKSSWLGIRRFTLHEDDSTLDECRQRLSRVQTMFSCGYALVALAVSCMTYYVVFA